jgi:hypothetical protein
MRWRNTLKLAEGADNPSVNLVKCISSFALGGELVRFKPLVEHTTHKAVLYHDNMGDRLVSLNLRKWWSAPVHPSGFSIREQLKTLYH